VTKKILATQLGFFSIVGGIGFCIDTTIFYLMHFSFNDAISRFFSILTAMTFTWLANRNVTFKVNKNISKREWIKYFSVNVTGMTINFSCFLFFIRLNPFFKQYFIIPLSMATGISMWFNFALSKYYTFKKKS